MNTYKRFVALTMVGLTLGGGVLGAETASAKSKVYTITDRTSQTTTPGTTQVVTDRDVSARSATTDETVTIPKNTALTIMSHHEGRTKVAVGDSNQPLWVNNLAAVTYSTQKITISKQARKKLNRQSRKWYKTLSKRQRQVLGRYTGEGSDAINNVLRKPKKRSTVQSRQRVKDLRAALKTFKLKQPMTVYRGTSDWIVNLSLGGKKLKPGAVYQDPGFASTTLSKSVGTDFMSEDLLKVNMPAGYHGAYLNPISEYEGEYEYLLNPNTKLVVTKIQKVTIKGRLKVTLKYGQHKHTSTVNENQRYRLITMSLMNK
ncbi:ADP-ribosyltransferase [Levilactobacillus humaensis]|uniref:ADP-ribosyltransferase n=1 Tax=Levilactobacillus humaensis TaxID=2950375 RepID=UPI0021C2EDE3|nr:ADP-ribosyltransferase [Levilactobacillus humaensis]